jgi:uncharacterized protein YigA (DUF484 family)
MFKKKQKDFIERQVSKLNALQNESNDAVDLVNRTITRLKHANQEALDTIASIDEYCANLQNVRDNLNKNCAHNMAIISNFSKLLDVDES